MLTQIVPISSLKLDPANARRHDEKNLAAIKGSLEAFGQQAEHFFKRVTITERGCWEFSDTQPHTGYGKFTSRGVTWRAHRWIQWALGLIERLDSRCVLHRCDNRSCVNPEHLYLGDRLENAQDIKRHGRSHLIRDPKIGSRNPSAKLTEESVREIRAALRRGEVARRVAERFGVSSATVSQIKTGKVWAHA